ncbi:MAG: serine hydrolase [Microcoleaceae cyanobacterium]
MIPEFPPPPDLFDPRVDELETDLRKVRRVVVKLQQQVRQLEQEQAAQRDKISASSRQLDNRQRSSGQRSWLQQILTGCLWGGGLVLSGFGAIALVNLLAPEKTYQLLNRNSILSLGVMPVSTHLSSQDMIAQDIRASVSAVEGTPHSIVNSSQVPEHFNSQPQLSDHRSTYQPTTAPDLNYSSNLQGIVNQVVNLAEGRQLSTENLSIYLIDIPSGTFAEYRSQALRFPASIAKLFWTAALYGQVEAGNISKEWIGETEDCQTDLCQLIQNSNNDAASRIVNQLSYPDSEPEAAQDYDAWLQKRYAINQFFRAAGFSQINISQKNYPIPSLGVEQPEGWELKMRGNPTKPQRNQISAVHAGRLMYEIALEQAVSPKASQAMQRLLRRNLNPETWTALESDGLYEFLGEPFIGTDIELLSKVGWTSDSRTEVVLIRDPARQVEYILVVFGSGIGYGADPTFFPELSQWVYQQMIAF